jgi:dolichyl-diphosphooligosaccharide--protein glycosyltransferase
VGRARRFGAPLAVFALALLVRAAPWRDVLGTGSILPVGSDAWYHLRRIVYGVFRHPDWLDFDRYVHFPHGAKPIWPPLFDRAIAALLRPFVPPLDRGGQAAVESLSMWVPPLLGAAAVAAAFLVARRHWGERVAWVAGVSLALVSGHFWYSQIGFVDHHAAVSLLATLLLAPALAMVAAHEAGARARVAAGSLALGALAALCLLVWPGCLLHVGLVGLSLLGVLLAQRDPAGARALAAALAAGCLLAAGLVAPSGLSAEWPQWGAYSPVVISRFQPWLLGCGTAVGIACALAWRHPGLGATRGRRAASLALACALALFASAGLAPGLVDGAGDAWEWLAKRDDFQARVAESQPLFRERGRFDTSIAVTRLSAFVLVFPLALPWLVWRARGRPELARTAMLAAWAGGLFAVTLLQRRFFDTASVGVALVLAMTCAELWRILEARDLRGWGAAVWLLLVAALAPALTPYARPAVNEWRVLRGAPFQVSPLLPAARVARDTARWLRDGTPETSGWLDADRVPEYGVLAPWPLGHAIQYVGRRPAVVDNFGDDVGGDGLAFADRYYRSREPEVADAAAGRGIRYVVAQRSPGFLSEQPELAALVYALFRRDGAEGVGPAGGRLAALVRHRLVFESEGLRFTDPGAEPVYKVFELVSGAVLTGRAAPGARIEVSLDVETNRGRRFRWASHAIADAAGRYRAPVPYATRGGPAGVRVAPAYRLRCAGATASAVVAEPQVESGGVVAAPDLCVGAAPASESADPRVAIDTGP